MVCDQETPSEVSEPSWIPWSSNRQLQGSGPSKWQLKLQKALLLSLKDFSGVEIRSLIQGYLQRMWSGLNLTMLGVVPPPHWSAGHWPCPCHEARFLHHRPSRAAEKAHLLLTAGCWRQPYNSGECKGNTAKRPWFLRLLPVFLGTS